MNLYSVAPPFSWNSSSLIRYCVRAAGRALMESQRKEVRPFMAFGSVSLIKEGEQIPLLLFCVTLKALHSLPHLQSGFGLHPSIHPSSILSSLHPHIHASINPPSIHKVVVAGKRTIMEIFGEQTLSGA